MKPTVCSLSWYGCSVVVCCLKRKNNKTVRRAFIGDISSSSPLYSSPSLIIRPHYHDFNSSSASAADASTLTLLISCYLNPVLKLSMSCHWHKTRHTPWCCKGGSRRTWQDLSDSHSRIESLTATDCHIIVFTFIYWCQASVNHPWRAFCTDTRLCPLS